MGVLTLLLRIHLDRLHRRERSGVRSCSISLLNKNDLKTSIRKKNSSMADEWKKSENVFHLVKFTDVGYLDNEQWLKDNPPADKPIKKARGGVASRKAKANSIALHAAKPSKPKSENQHSGAMPEEGSRNSTPSKAGDLSYVLNGPSSPPPKSTPSKSPMVLHTKDSKVTPTSAPVADLPPTFGPVEPAHNRNFFMR